MKNTLQQEFGVERWFRYHVHNTPNAEAIVEGEMSLTCRELEILAKSLTSRLSDLQIRLEEPVGIFLPMGIPNVTAQIAILRAGGSCVPLDLSFPDERIMSLLRTTGVRNAFTTARDSPRFVAFDLLLYRRLPARS